jgi:hypothetical protein
MSAAMKCPRPPRAPDAGKRRLGIGVPLDFEHEMESSFSERERDGLADAAPDAGDERHRSRSGHRLRI